MATWPKMRTIQMDDREARELSTAVKQIIAEAAKNGLPPDRIVKVLQDETEFEKQILRGRQAFERTAR